MGWPKATNVIDLILKEDDPTPCLEAIPAHLSTYDGDSSKVWTGKINTFHVTICDTVQGTTISVNTGQMIGRSLNQEEWKVVSVALQDTHEMDQETFIEELGHEGNRQPKAC